MSDFATDLRALGPANFLYCDGELLFSHGHQRRDPTSGEFRPPGLYLLHRSCQHEPGDESLTGTGISTARGPQEVTLVASVPLSDEDWTPLPTGKVVVLSAGVLQDPVD